MEKSSDYCVLIRILLDSWSIQALKRSDTKIQMSIASEGTDHTLDEEERSVAGAALRSRTTPWETPGGLGEGCRGTRPAGGLWDKASRNPQLLKLHSLALEQRGGNSNRKQSQSV